MSKSRVVNIVVHSDKQSHRTTDESLQTRSHARCSSHVKHLCSLERSKILPRSVPVSTLLRWDFNSGAVVNFDDQLRHLLVMFDHLHARELLNTTTLELTALLTSVHDGYTHGAGLQFTR